MANATKKIYVHCSASRWGNENLVNSWHQARKFLTMVNGYHLSTGYHLVILNGRPWSPDDYLPYLDGSIETARSFEVQGAGVEHDNVDAVHVCLVGQAGAFTLAQLATLYKVLAYQVKQGLAVENIWGHYEWWTKQGLAPMKTCPGMNCDILRRCLRDYIDTGVIGDPRPVTAGLDRGPLARCLDAVNAALGGNIENHE